MTASTVSSVETSNGSKDPSKATKILIFSKEEAFPQILLYSWENPNSQLKMMTVKMLLSSLKGKLRERGESSRAGPQSRVTLAAAPVEEMYLCRWH